MSSLFNPDGLWFKGNLHMHTTLSDGKLSPEASTALYKKAGYQFVALTDHWIQSKIHQTDDFLVLSGCEWDTGNGGNPVFHIIGAGMENQVLLRRSDKEKLGPQDVINAIKNAGGIAILAHPAWSVTNPDDCMTLKGLAGIEIFNSISELPWNGRRADSGLYVDICATQGVLFNCFAADDSHYYEGEQTHSFIMVKAPELSAHALKKAILNGDFYASQGPLLESVTIERDVVQVRCSNVKTAVFYSNTVWCSDRVTTGGVDFAAYRIKPTDRYVRIELIDFNGRMAWSSPFSVNA